jgi:hypothetical protein
LEFAPSASIAGSPRLARDDGRGQLTAPVDFARVRAPNAGFRQLSGEDGIAPLARRSMRSRRKAGAPSGARS